MTEGNGKSMEPPKDASTRAAAEDESGASQAPEAREPGESGPPEGPSLEAQLESAVAERDRFRDQLLRTAADFDNFRKRARRDIEEAERRAKEDVLREFLTVVDNLERAAQAAESAKDVKAVAEGVAMVLKGFDDVAGRIGLERVSAVGERFDPSLHDAVQQLETADSPAGAVVAEITPGYKFQDRLLRPAMVVVARAPQGQNG